MQKIEETQRLQTRNESGLRLNSWDRGISAAPGCDGWFSVASSWGKKGLGTPSCGSSERSRIEWRSSVAPSVFGRSPSVLGVWQKEIGCSSLGRRNLGGSRLGKRSSASPGRDVGIHMGCILLLLGLHLQPPLCGKLRIWAQGYSKGTISSLPIDPINYQARDWKRRWQLDAPQAQKKDLKLLNN